MWERPERVSTRQSEVAGKNSESAKSLSESSNALKESLFMDSPQPDATSLTPGKKVGGGRYSLIRELGRGGMGVVWLARDERLNDQVALKFLPAQIHHDPVALDDMRRETLRSRKLSHPNIIRIHDLQEAEGEAACISMEFVDGQNLTAVRMESGHRLLTWEFLQPLAGQLCDALEYAHGEKVIHRDLKPANMMLDSRGRLKLADFGIAAVVSDSMSRISLRHATSGTVAYMSPQQIEGQTPRVTDDVYALGASLYELLTSRPPFFSGDIVHQTLHVPPPPPEDRLAELELSNEIPPAVAALIMACLSKDPSQRPQSARAVAEWIGLESGAEKKTTALNIQVSRHAAPPRPAGPKEAEEVVAIAGKSAGAKSKVGWWIGLAIAAMLIGGFSVWLMKNKNDAGKREIGKSEIGKSDPAKPSTSVVQASSAPAPSVNASAPSQTTRPAYVPPDVAAADTNGWTQLFNGKDLQGWGTFGRDGWGVAQSNLVADFGMKRSNSWVSLPGEYKDFQLRFLTRFQNPGPSADEIALQVIVGWGSPKYPDVRTFAININHNGSVVGRKAVYYDSSGQKSPNDEPLVPVRSGTRVTIRDLNGKNAPSTVTAFPSVFNKPAFKPDAWTAWFIDASNTTVTVSCNGQHMFQLVDDGTKAVRKGHIVLSHGINVMPGEKVEIKDMFIKRLSN
jgi:serine/threonine protein kinase